jgi:hypothetical protein
MYQSALLLTTCAPAIPCCFCMTLDRQLAILHPNSPTEYTASAAWGLQICPASCSVDSGWMVCQFPLSPHVTGAQQQSHTASTKGATGRVEACPYSLVSQAPKNPRLQHKNCPALRCHPNPAAATMVDDVPCQFCFPCVSQALNNVYLLQQLQSL